MTQTEERDGKNEERGRMSMRNVASDGVLLKYLSVCNQEYVSCHVMSASYHITSGHIILFVMSRVGKRYHLRALSSVSIYLAR